MVFKRIQERFIENAPFSFNKVIFDSKGVPIDYELLECNPALEDALCINKSQVLGKSISEWLLTSETLYNNHYEMFKKLVLSDTGEELDELLELNGKQYYLTALVPYSGYLIIVLRDAGEFLKVKTDLQAIKDSLAASRALSQKVFDNSPFAIIIYKVINDGTTSSDYIIRNANPMCLKIEGWEREDVIGKTLKEVRPGVDNFGIVRAFQQVWETGDTVHYPAKVYWEGTNHRWFENTVFKLPSGEVVAAYEDITEKKNAEQELYSEREKLNVTLYSIGDGVITTDREGKVETINEVAEALTGWKQHDAKGMPLPTVFDIYNEITGEPCENPVDQVLTQGKIVGLANHTVIKSKDGTKRAIADSAAPIKTPGGDILGVVLVFRDVTEAKEREDRIKYLSYRDSLTGLYNRAYFEDELNRLDANGHFPMTLVMGDFDGLKLINEAFGHQVGDNALVELARILEDTCRPADVICRWGGDEFLILIPDITEESMNDFCRRIKDACRDIEVEDTKLSFSIGCAAKTDPEEPWQQVLKRAEDNMYKSKLLGAKSYRSIVLASMKNTLFERSFETEAHGERLGKFCREIGKSMGLSPHNIDELELLAMLHDIGKIAIKDHILRKPGELTKKEWREMKKHPEVGYRIAQTVPELINISEYILAHHERWDGKGYPRGLAGTDIPLMSRILAVVDAYDAMIQDRPYRKAISAEEAKVELKINAGTQFDPEVVDIFLKYLKEKPD